MFEILKRKVQTSNCHAIPAFVNSKVYLAQDKEQGFWFLQTKTLDNTVLQVERL